MRVAPTIQGRFPVAAVVCPHCNERALSISRVPKDVVAVMLCPACQELAILFRNKVIPLSRRIVEEGSFEERSTHFATVIAEFLEAGLFPVRGIHTVGDDARGDAEKTDAPTEVELDASQITDREIEDFVKVDLKYLDDASYFRENFG
jgi:hypothetical protein